MVDPCEWLIRKDGYFYRPNCQGYTTSKFEAGRYTKAEAEKEAAVEPWRMKAIHQDDVEDDPVSSRVRMDTARIAELEAEVERLTKALTEKRRDRIGDSEIAGPYLCRAEKAEALSRTGAVKVRELLQEIGMKSLALRKGGPDPMDLHGLSDALEEAIDLAVEADGILSTLEPAAPEIGSMEAYNAATKAMAARMATTAILVGDSEPSIDGEYTDADGYPYAFDAQEGQQPVTEAMVEAAANQLGFGSADSVRIRAALKAAMEAGR